MPDLLRKWTYAKPIEDDTVRVDQFALVESPIPELDDGEALVRVRLVNIHSSTRARMVRGLTVIGETDFSNYACAEVVRSRDPAFREGDLIACQAGWQDYQVIRSRDTPVHYAPPSELVKALNGTNSQWCYVFRPAMVKMWPIEVLMEMFGTSGMTAYFGLRECGPIMPSDCVAIAGATGSVGSIAAQLAKAAGAYVVGFGGGAERCKWAVETLGIDDCIDYRAAGFEARLRAAFPNGIDMFSDGIGGEITDAVTRVMNRNSRLFSFGTAGAYYSPRLAAAPVSKAARRAAMGLTKDVEARLKARNIKSQAWIVDAFYHERLKAEDDLSRLLLSGAVKPINNVSEGFESLPSAIVSLYRASRSGKLQVRFEPA